MVNETPDISMDVTYVPTQQRLTDVPCVSMMNNRPFNKNLIINGVQLIIYKLINGDQGIIRRFRHFLISTTESKYHISLDSFQKFSFRKKTASQKIFDVKFQRLTIKINTINLFAHLKTTAERKRTLFGEFFESELLYHLLAFLILELKIRIFS